MFRSMKWRDCSVIRASESTRIEGLSMYFLMMNVAHKPFDNKLVRQAVNYCCRCSGRS